MSIEVPFVAPAWVFLTLAAIILIGPLAAERIRLPGVIGLVLSGVLVGPEGLGLLSRSGTVEQLGGFGLLYLMFLAGLELDLAGVRADRRPTAIFGLLTFAVPMTIGVLSALALGFSAAAATLIGSLWASHTLVAYPIVRRSGIVADRSVTVAVGGTAITDTLALGVLAVVVGATESEGGVQFLARLVPGVAVLVVWTVVLLPRVARWFFRGMGQDRGVRFVFILVAFLMSAALADVVGVEGIIGAFLAGLSLNRLVPNGGILMQRVEFVGSSLLIPIFLISVGMLVDLRVVFDASTLGLAVVFSVVVIVSKAIAAEATGRILGFTRPQIGVMFGLSNAQAAATLAATIVGFEVGLFDERIVNAVLIVILVTVIVASVVATRSSPKVAPDTGAVRRVGGMVLAPISRPDSVSEIVRLATWIAQADGGQVAPFHVVTAADPLMVSGASGLLRLADGTASRLGTDVDAFVRVDRSVAMGVVNTVLERDASLVVLGWKGVVSAHDRLFGSVLDEIVAGVPCVVAACWLPGGHIERLVLMTSMPDAPPGDVLATIEVCRGLADGGKLPVAVIGELPDQMFDSRWQRVEFQAGVQGGFVFARGDLVIVPGGAGRFAVGSAAHQLISGSPEIALVAVHGPSPGREVAVTEIFAGG